MPTAVDTPPLPPVEPAPAPPAHRPGSRNDNPPGIGILSLLAEDLAIHDGKLMEQGFWAVAVHRFGNWRMGVRPKLLRAPFSVIYAVLYKVVEWTCGISLPYTVKLGRRVRIWHHGGMILHAAGIGDDVHIRQNTTFGVARRDQLHQLPTIEDRVDLGCGAVLVGAIRIGHDSAIGANSVVTKDVPPYSVAVGAPAKVVKELPPTPGAAQAVRARGKMKLKVIAFVAMLAIGALLAIAVPLLVVAAAVRTLL